MNSRIKILGVVLVFIGIAFVAGGGYAFLKVQDGSKSLQAFSAAQNVKLSYNADGQLVDGGKTESAQAILSLLSNDWGYPVVASDLNPNDPVVNTATEYMYQMATVAHHTLDSVQTVVLDKDVTAADGTVYKAGSYDFAVNGRYWAAFDRTNPIEAAARAQAWTGVAHGLIAELGVGTVTASTLQLGLGIAALFGALGGTFVLMGFGLVWATRPETVKVPALRPAFTPA